MSGYFTRLVGRTGLGPAPARPAQAAGAGIVEHSAEVAAIAPAEAAPVSFFGSARSDPALPAAGAPSPDAPPVEQEMTREQPAAFSAAPAIEKPPPVKPPSPLARTSSAESPRSRESAPPLPPAEAPAAPGQERMEAAGQTTPAQTELARAPASHARNRSEIAAVESASAYPPSPAPRLGEEPDGMPYEPLRERPNGSVKRAAWREDTLDSSRSKAYPASPAAPPRPGAQDVSVHIGTIQLEIRPPAEPPAARPAPPRQERARERPRFDPRRHYLRW